MYELFIAIRHLRAKRKQVFISFITLLSIVGIALGVIAVVAVRSVVNGFEREMRDKLISTYGHIRIQTIENVGIEDYERLSRDLESREGDIVAIAPLVVSEGMISLSTSKKLLPARIMGVDPRRQDLVSDFSSHLRGDLGDGRGVALGSELMRKLGAKIGDSVILGSIRSSGGRTIFPLVASESFPITGRFSSGRWEYDSAMVFMEIGRAQKLLGMEGKASWLQIKLRDPGRASEVKRHLDRDLVWPFWVVSWEEMERNYVAALEMEKNGLSLIMGGIIVVAAFGVVSTLIMMVMEKTKDIGILKSMGATNGEILRVFLWEGAIIGIAGIVIGNIGSIGILNLLDSYKFLEIQSAVYYITPKGTLPVSINPADFIVTSFAGLIACLLATIIPAVTAARLNPVEALRA